MKKFLPLVGALLIGVILGALIFRPSGPDAAYWVKRSVYDQDAALAATQDRADAALITSKDQVISAQTAEIASILAAVPKPSPEEKAKDTYIADLEEQIAAFETIGDTANALASAKEEITAWAEKFNLAERRHQDSLSALNNAWQVKFDAQVEISATWETAYNREHGLRLTCDALRTDLERQAGRGKFWKPVAITEALVIGALAIFGK